VKANQTTIAPKLVFDDQYMIYIILDLM